MSSLDIAAPRRIASLDQFRGYTVVGMLFVNFIGGFVVMPDVLKHHNTYCSYADTIMPQFFFAVGFAFRLTFLKRLETVGQRAAMLASLRRNLGLILVGVVLYHLDGEVKSWEELQKLGLWGFLTTSFTREPFQTLVHIALASLLVTPIIGSRPRVRVVALFAFGLLHLLLSYWFYFEYAWKRPVIDGGPLGFLTWSIPVLVGSLAYDAMVSSWTMPGKIARLLGGAIALCAVGYGLSCLGTPGHLAPPPFVAPEGEVNLWTMSQRTGSLSYQVFAAGFSLVVYALFVILTDMAGLETGIFRSFGRNALAAYVLHGIIGGAVKPWLPKDSPLWFLVIGISIYLAINYLFIRNFEKNNVYIKL